MKMPYLIFIKYLKGRHNLCAHFVHDSYQIGEITNLYKYGFGEEKICKLKIPYLIFIKDLKAQFVRPFFS